LMFKKEKEYLYNFAWWMITRALEENRSCEFLLLTVRKRIPPKYLKTIRHILNWGLEYGLFYGAVKMKKRAEWSYHLRIRARKYKH